MTFDKWSTGKVFRRSAIAGASSTWTDERTSFHRCDKSYVVGKFPLVLEVGESSLEVLGPAEDVRQEDIGWQQWFLVGGRTELEEREDAGVPGGCRQTDR